MQLVQCSDFDATRVQINSADCNYFIVHVLQNSPYTHLTFIAGIIKQNNQWELPNGGPLRLQTGTHTCINQTVWEKMIVVLHYRNNLAKSGITMNQAVLST